MLRPYFGFAQAGGRIVLFQFWPENRDWSWHLLRPMAEAIYGGGEAQECLRAAAKIQAGEPESWHAEWKSLADRVARLGEEALAKGRTVTARDHNLRASNYYRWAEFFLTPDDSRRLPTYQACVDCFREAGPFLDPPLERVEVPYGGKTLQGYFYPGKAGPGEDGKTPGALYVAGADVLKEELYFLGGKALIERGFSLLVMDGPGQGETLRLQNIASRPDYEVPVGAALDVLGARPEVDPGRLGLIGRSFGGYYATRAAAFEKRVRALVVFGALFSAVELFDDYATIRGQLQWLTGCSSPGQTRERLKEFTLEGVIDKVSCPVLVIHGEGDHLTPASHARRTFDGLKVEDKELVLYGPDEPGSVHCQYDSFPTTIPHFCDWLAEKLKA
ncbi:MAG: alpha/beta hydrolase family protein [Nitrospinota bacterium]